MKKPKLISNSIFSFINSVTKNNFVKAPCAATCNKRPFFQERKFPIQISLKVPSRKRAPMALTDRNKFIVS